ncbi:hypothetical protein ACLB2K_070634 [Fragaria x ananassa]
MVGASGDPLLRRRYSWLFSYFIMTHFTIFGYARSKMTDAKLRTTVSKTLADLTRAVFWHVKAGQSGPLACQGGSKRSRRVEAAHRYVKAVPWQVKAIKAVPWQVKTGQSGRLAVHNGSWRVKAAH